MPRGGYRSGAGRKSNAEIKNVRSILEHVITEQDWQALARDLFDRARRGDMRAAQLLLFYRFGDPFAVVPSEDEIKPIQFIRVLVNADGSKREIPEEEYRSRDPLPDPKANVP